MYDMNHYNDPLITELLRKYWRKSFNPLDSLAKSVIMTGIRTKRWWRLTNDKELRKDQAWNRKQSYWFNEHVEQFLSGITLRDWNIISFRWQRIAAMVVPERFIDINQHSAALSFEFDMHEWNDEDPIQFRAYLLDFIAGGEVPRNILNRIINESTFLLPDERRNIIEDRYAFWHSRCDWHLETMNYTNAKPIDSELTIPYEGYEEDEDENEYY